MARCLCQSGLSELAKDTQSSSTKVEAGEASPCVYAGSRNGALGVGERCHASGGKTLGIPEQSSKKSCHRLRGSCSHIERAIISFIARVARSETSRFTGSLTAEQLSSPQSKKTQSAN